MTAFAVRSATDCIRRSQNEVIHMPNNQLGRIPLLPAAGRKFMIRT
jgi:hypothetical protein